MIQNKFHYAITGKTAAEIVYENADRNTIHINLGIENKLFLCFLYQISYICTCYDATDTLS